MKLGLATRKLRKREGLLLIDLKLNADVKNVDTMNILWLYT
tara:strand:+ start:149 stop:271 length:123 start_codon:yes stop_codon:yes gene_type:complete